MQAGESSPPLALIQRSLQEQIKALNQAVRLYEAEDAWQHAAFAVALINEVTDLSLTAEDLLQALLVGAETGRSGQKVLDGLLEVGVSRRLLDRGTLIDIDGERRFTRADAAIRAEVRELLGEADSVLVDDPRWRRLLGDSSVDR